MNQPDATTDLAAQLARIEAKLDRLLVVESMVQDGLGDGMHIAREMTGALSPMFLELEAKGWFSKAGELWHVMDEIVSGYEVEDVRLLADNVVGILDTVRNLTQANVLQVANEATDVLDHPEKVEPMGPLGALGATRDPDVQRGMALMVEVMRTIGATTKRQRQQKALGGSKAPARRPAPVRGAAPAPRAQAPASPAPAAAPAAAAAPAGPPPYAAPGLDLNHEGFLTDASQWTPELGAAIAADLGITMTDDHWQVVGWIRQTYAELGVSPNVRAMGKGSGVDIASLYQLFPQGPGKKAAKIAGVPKPAGCI